MKRLLLFLLPLVAACSTSTEYTISGVVKNFDADEIVFNPSDDGTTEDVTIQLAEDGSFSYTCRLGKNDYGYFRAPGRAYFALICIGGTSTHVVADAATGKLAASGDLQSAYVFQKRADSILFKETAHVKSFKELKQYTNHIADSLKRAAAAAVPQKAYVKLLQEYVQNPIFRTLVRYDETLQKRAAKPDSDPDYNRFMEEIPITSNFTSYKYVYWKEWCKKGDLRNKSTLSMLQIAKARISDQELLENFSKSLLTTYFTQCDSTLDEVYNEALPLMRSEKSVSWLQSKYEANSRLLHNAKAIDCPLENIKGEKSKLSDLFGKVLYIDVWATWCGPCCAEIPYMEKLAKHFAADKRISLVSISVDSDRDKWVKKLQADKPEWKQFLNSEFTTLYGIVGIPCFMLIDKEGNIIDKNAPRPSSPHIIEYLEAAL